MSPRRKILLISICFFVLAAIAVYLRGPREPRYQGRSLTEWCDMSEFGMGKPDMAQREEAQKAIREIGTNALPFALRLITQKQYPQEGKFYDLIMRLPWVSDRYNSLALRRRQGITAAVVVFYTLGEEASSAIPRLCELTQKGQPDEIRVIAFSCLAALGDAGLPLVAKALDDPEDDLCYYALSLIARGPRPWFNVSTNAAVLLPKLIQFTQNEYPLGEFSIRAIGRIAAEPDRSIPVLTNALKSQDPALRGAACDALSMFGAVASNAAPAIELVLQDPDPAVRDSATNALGAILRPDFIND